jgi:hypothetical protein
MLSAIVTLALDILAAPLAERDYQAALITPLESQLAHSLDFHGAPEHASVTRCGVGSGLLLWFRKAAKHSDTLPATYIP